MSPELWRRVKELCLAALDRAPHKRTAYLEEACHEDRLLLREVQSLLSFEVQAEKSLKELPPEFVAAAFCRNVFLDGSRIENYLVHSLLGRGGMGDVYLAEDTDLGRNVALKVLPKEFINDDQRLQRFKQEARAASALKHPNIITIYSVGHEGGIYFIATEYVRGLTLRQRLAVSGRLELREALNVAIQITSALEAAHHAGIVHRDVKPDNIMFEPDGTAKLLDFGIAKLTEDNTAEEVGAGVKPLKTEQGVILGTPAYMSPEQARHQPLDHRSDLFSLGVVFYEMITGEVPFAGGTPYDQQAAVLTTEPTPVELRLDRVAPGLQWVISKTLTKEPERRYQTATDLLIDLQRLDQSLKNEEVTLADNLSSSSEPATALAETISSVSTKGQPSIEHSWRISRRTKFAATGLLIVVCLIAVVWLTGLGRRLAGLMGLSGPPPVIEAIVPDRPIDIIGDQPIEVRGRHFQDGLKIKVEFPNGGSNELSGAQIQKQEGKTTSFNILFDLNGNPGTYAFQILNPDGQVSPRFTFEARHETLRPVINWIEPVSPKTSSGEQPVTVYGHNFQMGLRVEVIQPSGDTSELGERQIANRTANSFQGLFFFHLPGKHSIRVVNPNGGKSEYFDILVQ
jgi:serine/threonine protein kinase